jgi:hypothetical protein
MNAEEGPTHYRKRYNLSSIAIHIIIHIIISQEKKQGDGLDAGREKKRRKKKVQLG